MLGPIFIREWLILPRRSRHYLTRAFYLGTLWVLLFTTWQTTVGWEHVPTLGDLARFGLLSFQILAYVQLTLLMFFSALSAASTISLEKDRRTFLLLLLTELRNDEIVVGKLCGSLFQIILLLLGSIPVFALLALLGGIDPWQIVDVMLVLTTASFAAGSLGGLIALWREKTFQALAMTVLFLVLYLCLVNALAVTPYLVNMIGLGESGLDADAIAQARRTLEPFLALAEAINRPEDAAGLTTPRQFALAMLGIAALLNLIGMYKLRVWNPSGEPIMQRELVGAAKADATDADPDRIHAAPGKARPVWANPILWREIATRAYGNRPLVVKLAYFVVVGLIGYYSLFLMERAEFAAAWGIVPVTILSLLLISAQSVTSITSERDLNSLDLLLITDLSPKEFILGKVFGIVYNTKEFIVPPLILVVIYAMRGQLGTPPRGQDSLLVQKNIEGALALGIGMLVVMAFTVMLGIHVALRANNSRQAAINALGTVFFLTIGTMVCIYLIRITGRFEYQWLSFAGFIVAGIGGLWWVLSAERPSSALNLASGMLPVLAFYSITNVLIGKPGSIESADPLIPFIVTAGAFSFTILAMAIPLMSEFDVAVGRSSAVGE
ncbi:MAG: ABC transporter permease [Gemmataceae bacterium]|nr:ABC transporter permease [Gemmataceae bacterium]